MAERGGPESQRRARGQVTRGQLIEAGRSLFATRGYVATSITDIVEASGVGTRGAFYHHFPDKRSLFRAVFEQVEADLVLRAISDPPTGEPWARLVEGLHGFLDAALEPEVQQIMLIDAPAVLGWRTRREIEEASSIAEIEAVLRKVVADGTIVDLPVADLAHVVSAMVQESALLVAHSPDPDAARLTAGEVLDRLLLGLVSGRVTEEVEADVDRDASSY